MKPIRTDAAAEAELRAAILRYEEIRPGLGDEFWYEVQETLRLIADHPEIGSGIPRVRVRGGVRRFPTPRFPYFVIYRIRSTEIEIVAFAHQSQRPGYWAARAR